MTTPRSPRRVRVPTVAGFVFVGIALATWSWCAFTNWWLADLLERPKRELDTPIAVVDGSRATAPFTPNAGIPHLLHLEFDAGFPTDDDGPCPIALEWSVAIGDRVVAGGDGADLAWRVGEPGMGIVWLGRFDAARNEEHLVTVRVDRGLPDATARLQAVWDSQYAMNHRMLAVLLSMAAWAPLGLGLILLLVAWFLGRFRIHRRP